MGRKLLEIWPSYVGYVVSFVTIGIIWINHHTFMAQIGKVDRLFLLLNVGLLPCVAFIPFPTRLVTEQFRSEGARAAALVYGVTLTASVVLFGAGRGVLRRGELVVRQVSDEGLSKVRYITSKAS